MPATLTSAATPESTIKMMVFRVLSAVALLFYVAIYLPLVIVFVVVVVVVVVLVIATQQNIL
ncbi:hypothetical protein LY78DRAFT_683440 [Colletotrichum sublineola]|nr:hypothetical protein LY78DRAFT_683440 [Colletotrichum sublineola]